mmetsp:Transcript_72910/g.213629  ORF Transcript_72910/g.213629 Transcript_72910/m.213629 type:complete len:421 (-) Transcript_72910:249-1511(-)
MLRHSLDAARVNDHLNLAHVNGQEVYVSDAETGLLSNLAHSALLICLDGVISPGINVDELVHGLSGKHVPDVLQGVERPICHPGGYSWASQVPAAADEVDLACAKLTAGTDVFHREGAMPNDRHGQALQEMVVNLIEHSVADVPLEVLLALVGLLPGQREVAREHADGPGVELLHRCLLVPCLLRHELPVPQPRFSHLLRPQLIPDHLQGLRPGPGALVGDDVHLLDVGVERDVGHDSGFVDAALEHVEKCIARGPRGREEGGDRVVLAKAEVVGAVLRLQLGCGVRLVHPRGSANPVHAIEHAEVQLLPLNQEHCHAEAKVARPDDHLRVVILVRLAGEGFNALHKHVPVNLLMWVQLPVNDAAGLVHKLDVIRVYGELECHGLRELQDGGARHAGDHLLFTGRRDLQGHGDPGLAAPP